MELTSSLRYYTYFSFLKTLGASTEYSSRNMLNISPTSEKLFTVNHLFSDLVLLKFSLTLLTSSALATVCSVMVFFVSVLVIVCFVFTVFYGFNVLFNLVINKGDSFRGGYCTCLLFPFLKFFCGA